MSAKGFSFPKQCDKKKVFFAVCGPNTKRKPFTQRFFRAAETKKKESGLLTKERHDAVVVIVTCGKPNTHIKIFWQNDYVCYLHKKDDGWRKSHLGGQLRCVLRDTKLASSFVRGGKVVIGAGQTRNKPCVQADPLENQLPRRDRFVQPPFGPPRPTCNGVNTRQVLREEGARIRAVEQADLRKRKCAAEDKEGVKLFRADVAEGVRAFEPAPALILEKLDPWEHSQPGTDYFDYDDDSKEGFTEIPLHPADTTEAKAALERHRKPKLLPAKRGWDVDYAALPVQAMVLRNDE
jgi:hypothetical protein